MGQEPNASFGYSLRRRIRSLITPLAVALGCVLAWEAAGRILGFRPDILPTPSRIALEGLNDSDKLIPHGLITVAEMLGGLLLSLAVSALVAAGALVPAAYRWLSPSLSLARRAPLIVAAPLAFIWFGFGLRSILLLAGLLSFPGLALGFVTGLRSAPEDVLELARLAGADPLSILLKIRLPAVLPSAFAAMKSAVPMVVAAVIVGEFLDGEKGLGYLMVAATSKLETTLVFAALILTLLLGLLIYTVVAFIELAFLHRRSE
jgi:ABC-type nitrate/sulfonate/bicarbonate transport system permease component